MDTIWKNRKDVPIEKAYEVATKYLLRPEVAMILLKREYDINKFLTPRSYNGRLMKGAEKAAEIIENHIREGNLICVVNDYDVDGITSGVIMADTIEFFGGRVIIETPDREIDGYGISKRIVEKAVSSGATLIVTTDNGIAAREELAYAKERGLSVVVTDHHAIPFEIDEAGNKNYILPNADVVVDPHQKGDEYPMKDICGAVVASKICEIMLERNSSKSPEMVADMEKWLLELSTLGTICDVMPLIDENRDLVKNGLLQLRGTRDKALISLMNEMNIDQTKISSYNIGFHIGPVLNSVGRMTGSADEAVRFLREKDEQKILEMAKSLCKQNEERKEENARCEALAMEMAEGNNDRVLLLYLPNERPSLMGIVAGRIKESLNRPCVCLTDAGDGILRGSGRSIEGYDMFHYFSLHRDLFEKFGGHEGAIGLSVKKDNLGEIREVILKDAADLPEEIFEKKVDVDLFMDIGRVTIPLVEAINKLEPFGKENPKPIFCAKNVRAAAVQTLSEGKYLKLRFESPSGNRIDGMVFKNADKLKQMITADEIPALDILYSVSINTWKGNISPQAIIEDFRVPEAA